MFKKIIAVAAILLAVFVTSFFATWLGDVVHAQTAQVPLTLEFNSTQVHSSCPPVAASVTQYCLAYDGVWASLAGAAYIQLAATATQVVTSIAVNGGAPQVGNVALTIPPAGVVSFNGQAGAVTYTAPVTSVFGRTGAVLPLAGDYSYAQLSSPPTSVTGTGLSITGATIK